jgi:hypothetical protein
MLKGSENQYHNKQFCGGNNFQCLFTNGCRRSPLQTKLSMQNMLPLAFNNN